MSWDYKIEFPMRIFCCSNCGIPFGIPQDFEGRRREDGETFYCPNGHEQYFPVKEEQTPDVETRRELVLAIHRAEQAEAKAAELQQGNPSIPLVAMPQQAAAPTNEPGKCEVKFEGRYCVCPHCKKKYVYWRSICDHLQREHQVEPSNLPMNKPKIDA